MSCSVEASERCCSGDPISQCERQAIGKDYLGLPACEKHQTVGAATSVKPAPLPDEQESPRG